MYTYKKICITNRNLVKEPYLERLEKLAASGDMDLLILREKDLTEDKYETLAAQVLAICARYDKPCILHYFAGVAKRLGHPHIHLPMREFLRLTQEEKAYFQTIGVSAHSLEDALTAQEQGASYITASHIFATQCKAGLEPRGLAFLEEICRSVDIPVYALGGIHPHNMNSCIEAGADGICMMSEYMQGAVEDRYTRQRTLPEIGAEGQRKLRQSSVLIVGAGGLGSPAALYLAGAGIGKIGLVDADAVDLTNLHRQIIHETANIGKNKAESAKERMQRLNNEVEVETYPCRLTPDNIMEIMDGYDFVIDAVDNFETKFLINDACVIAGKPFSHAGIIGFQGQAMTYVPGEGPCYRCIFEEIPEPGSVADCKKNGVIGMIAGILGCIQALEAVKCITGAGRPLTGKMYVFNGLTMESRIAGFPKGSPACRVCGPERNIFNVRDNRDEYL